MRACVQKTTKNVKFREKYLHDSKVFITFARFFKNRI